MGKTKSLSAGCINPEEPAGVARSHLGLSGFLSCTRPGEAGTGAEGRVALWPVCSSVPISVTARRGQRCPRRGGRGQRALHTRVALEGGVSGSVGRKGGRAEAGRAAPSRFSLTNLPPAASSPGAPTPAPRVCCLRGAVASTLEQGCLWGRRRSLCAYTLQSPRPAGVGSQGSGTCPPPRPGTSQAFLATCGPHGNQLGWRDRAWLPRAWQRVSTPIPALLPSGQGWGGRAAPGREGWDPRTSPETVLPLGCPC